MSAPEKAPPSTLESQALYNLALESISRNRYGEALAHLREALRIAPENPAYLSSFGLCLAYAAEDFDMAVKFCRRALMYQPNDPVLLVNLGKVYRLKGDKSSAYAVFLDAWQRDKRHPAPATELSRMGIRRPPVIQSLPRSHWCNKYLGIIRATIMRFILRRRIY